MKYGTDFTVEPIPKRHGHKQTVKPFYAKKEIMDTANTVKQFKNPPEIREYWRIHKQKQRALGGRGKLKLSSPLGYKTKPMV
jgi:hypothetical protein